MRRFNWLVAVVSALASLSTFTVAQEIAPQHAPTLQKAHSHNDYYHSRPLLDALDQGFCSVEADVFLVDGKLLVGHERSELLPERSLEALYLKPLAERVARNCGHVHSEPATFMLLVDFKNDGASSFAALQELLQQYEGMLSKTVDGEFQPGAVEVVISGDRPWEQVAAEQNRFAGVDGRVADLDDPARRAAPVGLMPLVSDSWFTLFRWNGRGPMPSDEREKLKKIVDTAHNQGRRVRFWATPEVEAVWRELQSAGVDHINTDQLDRLRRFLSDAAQ